MEKVTSSSANFSVDSLNPKLVFLIVAILCFGPLFLSPVAPLVDFYAHIARYFVLANIEDSATLNQYYQAEWRLLPNLGMDILGTAIMHLLPPMAASKVLLFVIVGAPFLGTVYLSYVVQGRLTVTGIVLAGALAHSHILIWGFANFLLGLGIAMGSLGLWIRLRDRPMLQLAVGAVFAVILICVHGLVFAFWGFLLGWLELNQAWQDKNLRVLPVAKRMGRLLLLAAIPFLMFIQTDTVGAEGGVTRAFANLGAHADSGTLWPRIFEEILRRFDALFRASDSQNPLYDRVLGAVLWLTIAASVLTGAMTVNRKVWGAVLGAGLLFVFLPPNILGVGHLEERPPLLLLAFAAAGLSINAQHRLKNVFGCTIVAVFVAHSALVFVNWQYHGSVYRDYIAKLETVDTGEVGVAFFVGEEVNRDTFRPNCKPLLFMMLIKNGTAVPTFAYATQQPLSLKGPLQKVLDDFDKAPAVSWHPSNAAARDEALAYALNVGADSVISCENGERSPSDTARILEQGDVWTIYGPKP